MLLLIVMEENKPVERVKATDKTKKKTFGGFFSNFKRWDTRGKSSKQLKEMIEDLKSCIWFELGRIKRLKYVIQCLKENIKEERHQRIKLERLKQVREVYKRKLTNQKNKVKTRDANLENKDAEISELEKELKLKERETARLLRELDKKDDKLEEVRSRKRRVIVKEVEQPLTLEAQRLERMVSKPLAERSVNYLDVILKTAKFLEGVEVTQNQLTTLLQCEVTGYITNKNLYVGDIEHTATLTQKGYLSVQKVNRVNNYFLTAKGKDIVKNYKNYLSYSTKVI